MNNSPPQESSEGDVDHGLGDIDTFLIIADEASPARHPTESALDHPAAWQHSEARLGVQAAHDLDDEILKSRLFHQGFAVVGAVSEQMLDPGPALADRVQDRLCTSTIGNI